MAVKQNKTVKGQTSFSTISFFYNVCSKFKNTEIKEENKIKNKIKYNNITNNLIIK